MPGASPATHKREFDPPRMAERLSRFVAGELRLGAERVRAAPPRRMAGGASRETWSVEIELEPATGSRERLDLVLRRDPPGRVGEGDRGLELRLLRAAAAGGVPVPRVWWGTTDPSVLGSPFFLMDRVVGETLPRRLLRDSRYERARKGMAAELGEILASIHAIDPDQPELRGLPAPPPDVSPARTEVERHATTIRALAVEPHPVLELAERWLLERAPDPPRRTLVHGDYRIGNVIFDEAGVRAILDWELAHVGDPLEDLGWLCTRAWRFGNDALAAGGVGTREELVAAYEKRSGLRVDPAALRFWETFGSFKLALVFISQARVFLDGRVRSVELAALGRRTAEAEEELLQFLRSKP